MTAPNVNPDDVSRVLMLVFGPLQQGGMYWCYVAVKPSRYEEFKGLAAGKKYNIQDYAKDGFGEVIVSGEGGLPPQEVTKQVAAIFGIPLKDLFNNANPLVAINKAIEVLKKNAGEG